MLVLVLGGNNVEDGNCTDSYLYEKLPTQIIVFVQTQCGISVMIMFSEHKVGHSGSFALLG